MSLALIIRWLLCVVGVAISCTSSRAGDWPQWRGPEGTGVSTEKGVPIVWHEGRGVVWKCELPEGGNSTPAIWGQAVFLTTHTADDQLLVLRINKKSGQMVWTREAGSAAAAAEGPAPQRQT